MKRFSKIIVRVIALVMMCTALLSFSACADIKQVELKIAVYNYTDKVMYSEDEVTMTVDLYRHLAPETVDTIISYINDGYYDNAIFYKTSNQSSQFMVGDLKLDGDDIVQNAIMPTIDGEFEKGGTSGSNLLNKRGSIGLWRTWTAYNSSYNTSADTDTGRATWFIPTSDITSYDKWFCVFAQIDFENENNETAISAITDCFASADNYDEYVIYYTGEYDATKTDENHGLTFNCVLAEDFVEDDVADIFVAEGDQYVCYNKYTIKVPKTNDGVFSAKIISAKVI